MSVLFNIEPKKVFEYFETICAIPHGSGNTLAISNYLVSFAKEHQLKYVQDESNNVVIYKEGTHGYENSAPVILQGHMDMVCVKNEDCPIDLEKDGLSLQLEDGIIHANGTTLGGDDGIAVAIMLAILEATDLPHPPLEAVFTVDEEIGMLGAAAFDYSLLSGRTMLNLDSEEEGYLLVSCAGGATATCNLPVSYEALSPNSQADSVLIRIRLSGISGGHSGMEIIKEGANASKLLGRFLYMLTKQADILLVQIEGGTKDNAIPTEAFADVVVKNSDMNIVNQLVTEYHQTIQHEFENTDPDILIDANTIYDCSSQNPSNTANNISAKNKHIFFMTVDSSQRVISALVNLPNGVIKMSEELPGLVQTSLNLGILTTAKSDDLTGTVTYSFSVRSSVGIEKEALIEQLESLVQALGGSLSVSGNYPAWEYKKDSKLLSLMIDTFKELYGKEPVVQSIHAGVECGLFCEGLQGLDCVSYGPDMKDIHTSRESMDVASVKRTWEYTLEILKRLV